MSKKRKFTHKAQSADLMVKLLVAGIEGLEFFTNEFIKYAPVYQRLAQLSDLCPVVPRVAEHVLQRLVMNEEMGTRIRKSRVKRKKMSTIDKNK